MLPGLIVRFADYTLMWFLWTAYPQDRRNGRTSQNRLLDKIEVLVGQPGSSDSHPPLKLLLDRSSSLRQIDCAVLTIDIEVLFLMNPRTICGITLAG